MALKQNGEFLLRIEDIDKSRARPEWEAQIYDDLSWLGVSWPETVMRQSDRLPVYRERLQWLWDLDYAFACSCSRSDIEAAASAPQEGADPRFGPDGIIYPGTCRSMTSHSGSITQPVGTALRLNMAMTSDLATPRVGEDSVFSFEETGHSPNGQTGLVEFTHDHALRDLGDIVLARREMGTSYHLSVVLDDAAQGVTHVVRGQDLFETTKIHVILQRLLNLPTPTYHHHKLIRDDTGKRLAKRDDARAILKFREDGASPEDIREMVGL